MKISTILDYIDSGHIALPEFQRGYVWNRDQVRGLFGSLYRRHPVGELLVWATESKTATHRGASPLAAGVVKLLLDGQQRMTSLYGVVRGKPPQFFDGHAMAFTGLRFHLDTETFAFHQPLKMQGDPLWIDVTELMQRGHGGIGEFVARLNQQSTLPSKLGDYVGRLSQLLGIMDIDLHIEEVTGADKSLDVAGLEKLLEQLRLRHGSLRAEPGHFTGWSLGARFYPVLYLLTRMGEAQDWGTGLPLKNNLLGRMSKLEVHHIFPKAQLYRLHHKRPEVNALANFCFLTKDTNLTTSARLPEEYFPAIEQNHPGALASQWIPADPALWKIENYLDFLDARRELLAAETNKRLAELLHGDLQWLEGAAKPAASAPVVATIGGITREAEEEELEALNDWVEAQKLPRGVLAFDFADAVSGEQKAVFDLAWPNGIQAELSQPVTVLFNENTETLALASRAGFRCFTTASSFRAYVQQEILANEDGQNTLTVVT